MVSSGSFAFLKVSRFCDLWAFPHRKSSQRGRGWGQAKCLRLPLKVNVSFLDRKVKEKTVQTQRTAWQRFRGTRETVICWSGAFAGMSQAGNRPGRP